MKYAAVLFVALVCSGALASEPGQPLDCSDWQLLEPGLVCEESVIPENPPGIAVDLWDRSNNLAIDNTGRLLTLQSGYDGGEWSITGWYNPQSSITIRAQGLAGQPASIVASTNDRMGTLGFMDHARPVRPHATYPPPQDVGHWTLGRTLVFDPVAGRLIIPIEVYCGNDSSGCPNYSAARKILSIRGFATLYDVSQTYTPQASLGFRVPYMPEGMAGADHFDTYWGPLAHPIDFTQAHPLQCNYPAVAPHVGDYLIVADYVPTPEPGQGIYYVTATTYQGTTRYGRKTTAGHLSGRDPAVLPVCMP